MRWAVSFCAHADRKKTCVPNLNITWTFQSQPFRLIIYSVWFGQILFQPTTLKIYLLIELSPLLKHTVMMTIIRVRQFHWEQSVMSSARFTRPANDLHENSTTQRPSRTVLNFGNHDDNDNDGDKSLRESLLKESGHLTRAEQLIDEQYDLAMRTRENLVNQRWTIRSMRGGLNSITERFVSVNDLIKRIKLRKRRDTIIVAIVFSICLGFLLYNIFFWLTYDIRN